MIPLRQLFPNTVHRNTSRQQLDKVVDELIEAEHELKNCKRVLFLIETIDVIHAACGILYKSEFQYTDEEIDRAIRFVQDKNRQRGYYGQR